VKAARVSEWVFCGRLCTCPNGCPWRSARVSEWAFFYRPSRKVQGPSLQYGAGWGGAGAGCGAHPVPVAAARPVPCGLEPRDPSQRRLGARVRSVSDRAMSFNVQVGSGPGRPLNVANEHRLDLVLATLATSLEQAWPFPHTRKKSTRICCPVGVGSTGCVLQYGAGGERSLLCAQRSLLCAQRSLLCAQRSLFGPLWNPQVQGGAPCAPPHHQRHRLHPCRALGSVGRSQAARGGLAAGSAPC
jgi:hypothetical protein